MHSWYRELCRACVSRTGNAQFATSALKALTRQHLTSVAIYTLSLRTDRSVETNIDPWRNYCFSPMGVGSIDCKELPSSPPGSPTLRVYGRIQASPARQVCCSVCHNGSELAHKPGHRDPIEFPFRVVSVAFGGSRFLSPGWPEVHVGLKRRCTTQL